MAPREQIPHHAAVAWERAQDGDRGEALQLLSIANLKLLLFYFGLVQRYDAEGKVSMIGRLVAAMTVKGLLERAYLEKYVMAPESGPAGVVLALVRGLYWNRDGTMSEAEIRNAAKQQGFNWDFRWHRRVGDWCTSALDKLIKEGLVAKVRVWGETRYRLLDWAFGWAVYARALLYGHCPGSRLSLPADPAFQKVTKTADLVAVGAPAASMTPSSTSSPTSGTKRTAPQSAPAPEKKKRAPKQDHRDVMRAKCHQAAEDRNLKNQAAGDPSTTKPVQINLIGDDDDDDDGPAGPTPAPTAGSTKAAPIVIDDSDDESSVTDLT